jgi:hypothetical protein
MSIVTLDQAKAQLNIDPDDDSQDGELQGYVDAITGAVEEYKHEIIELRTITEEVETCPVRRLRVYSVPAVSLVSVQMWDASVTWDITKLRLSAEGILRVMSGPPVGGGLVEVTLTAGYAQVPPRYVRGALVILQHTWETQRGVGAAVQGVIGREEVRKPAGSAFSIPNKALEWLGKPLPLVA